MTIAFALNHAAATLGRILMISVAIKLVLAFWEIELRYIEKWHTETAAEILYPADHRSE